MDVDAHLVFLFLVKIALCRRYAYYIYYHLGVDGYCDYSVCCSRRNTDTHEKIGVLTLI